MAALAILSGCASSRFDRGDVTGATNSAGPTAAYNQPMPPALVGTNPVVQGQANAGTQTGPVTATALPPVTPAPTTTVQPTTVAAATPTTPAAQGSIITVQAGQTLYSLSRTYGVSVAAIAAANGLTQTSTLTIGQRLTIPAAGTTGALGTPPAPLGVMTENGTVPTTAATTTPTTTATVAQPVANTGAHVVQTGETLYSISMRYGISVNALASANGLTPNDIVRVGQQLVIPGGGTAQPQQVAATQPQTTTPPAATPEPTPTAVTPTETPPAQTAALTTTEPTTPAAGGEPSVNGTSFRWPAQGRIISDFGPKPGGERNDGINISLPVGTEIRASEAGRVIYAGNEIPGYGNLILVEHADNWVTAYAHLSQMSVSQGQTVSRGAVIGLAGNTGAVTASQLHFEIRRNATPVNPLDYLTN